MSDSLPVYSVKAIEILDAAELRIRRGGFDAVSYRDLAADVGIKAASVHYHFPQKALLGAAVVDRYADRLLAALGPVDLAQATVAVHLQRLSDAYGAAVREEGLICLGCILGAGSRDLPDRVAAAVSRFFSQLLHWTEMVLGNYPDPVGLAVQVVGTLQGTMILSVTLNRPELMAEAAKRVRELVAV